MTPASRGDRIEIRSLRVVATHGALPEERERPQPFELDIDFWVGVGAGGTDTLADTVDYGTVVSVAAGVVRNTSFILLEGLAEAVAGAVLGLDHRVERVAITVRKLRPPIGEDVGTVAVRVVRPRRESLPPK